jgi:hypothetical protein
MESRISHVVNSVQHRLQKQLYIPALFLNQAQLDPLHPLEQAPQKTGVPNLMKMAREHQLNHRLQNTLMDLHCLIRMMVRERGSLLPTSKNIKFASLQRPILSPHPSRMVIVREDRVIMVRERVL